MRVLLISTYELGHQPLHLAVPAARLRADGWDVVTLDLAVEPIEWEVVASADLIAISVPMHTAMVLAAAAARKIKERHPSKPIALYGLYAGMGSEVGAAVDHALVGEYVEALSDWTFAMAAGVGGSETVVRVGRPEARVPDRSSLPPLDRYAHLAVGDEHRIVGYVEATHGCRHECRHCPIPVVYGGRFRAVDLEIIRADVDQLVGLGARHITFGDPDFLNGPAHAKRVLSAVHGDHPHLSFDVTVKVEHILQHQRLWPSFAERGVLFVVSAYESLDDRTLRLMDKGHVAADLAPATAALRDAGIEVRPSWLPFTPWTALDQIPELFSFLAAEDLLGSVDPVQLAIRLLIPPGSLLLDLPETRAAITGYDAEALSYTWMAPDPRLDELQTRLAAIAEAGADRNDHAETLLEQWAAVVDMTATEVELSIPAGATAGRPRLTEPWFC